MTIRTIVLAASALAIVAAGVWTYLAYHHDLRASRERLQNASRIIVTASGPVEYAEVGEGPPIIVVHGAGGGFDQGLEIAEPLAALGFRVIAMSRFGYLRTPMPVDASVAAQAQAHASLMDALGIPRAAIFGISAGGPSATQFAIDYPGRCAALVLMVPMAYKPAGVAATVPRLSPLKEKVLTTIVGSDFAYWLATKVARSLVFRTVMGTPPEIVAAATGAERMRVERMMDHILPISERSMGILNDSAISNSLTPFDLEKITARALVLSARDDLYGTYASAQYTAQVIDGAKFTGYGAGGHMLVGHTNEVIAAIGAFLRRSNDISGALNLRRR